jgi:hypothetical protein
MVAQPPRSYGLSAVNISSLANGALGEHRRYDSDGIKLEIRSAGMPVESPLEQTVRDGVTAG